MKTSLIIGTATLTLLGLSSTIAAAVAYKQSSGAAVPTIAIESVTNPANDSILNLQFQPNDFPGAVSHSGQVTNPALFQQILKRRVASVSTKFGQQPVKALRIGFKGFDFSGTNGPSLLRDVLKSEVHVPPGKTMVFDVSANHIDNAGAAVLLRGMAGTRRGGYIDLSNNNISDPGEFRFDSAQQTGVDFRGNDLNAAGVGHVLDSGVNNAAIDINTTAAANMYGSRLGGFARNNGTGMTVRFFPKLNDDAVNTVISPHHRTAIARITFDFRGRSMDSSTLKGITQLLQNQALRALRMRNANFANDGQLVDLNRAVANSRVGAYGINGIRVSGRAPAAADFYPLADARNLKELDMSDNAVSGSPDQFARILFDQSRPLQLRRFNASNTTFNGRRLSPPDMADYVRSGRVGAAVLTASPSSNSNFPDLFSRRVGGDTIAIAGNRQSLDDYVNGEYGALGEVLPRYQGDVWRRDRDNRIYPSSAPNSTTMRLGSAQAQQVREGGDLFNQAGDAPRQQHVWFDYERYNRNNLSNMNSRPNVFRDPYAKRKIENPT